MFSDDEETNNFQEIESSDNDIPNEDDYESKYEGDYEEKDDTSKNVSPSSAGIQFMITNRMKKILIDNLQYLPDEVEELEPQIAAFLIDKNLPRPLKGVPPSWKRTIRDKSIRSSRINEGFKRFCKGLARVMKRSLPVVLPILVTIAGIQTLRMKMQTDENFFLNKIFHKSKWRRGNNVDLDLLRKVQTNNRKFNGFKF